MTEEFPTQTTREKDSNKKKRERAGEKQKRGRPATHEALCITIF